MQKSDVAIIGGGPAGYSAALECAARGKSVLVFEAHKLGGTCLHVGCVPSKTLLHFTENLQNAQNGFGGIAEIANISVDYEKLHAFKNNVIQKLERGIASLFKAGKVKLENAEAKIIGRENGEWKLSANDADFHAEHLIVASGSKPAALPFLPFDNDAVLDNAGALALKTPPKTLAVIGAGAIGLELGSVFARLGANVTILEALPQLLPSLDDTLKPLAARAFKGLNIHLNTKLLKGTKTAAGVLLEFESPSGVESLTADKVIVAIGRKPNTLGLPTNAAGFLVSDESQNFWVAGDVAGQPMLAHKAYMDARFIAQKIAGESAAAPDYNNVPQIIYTQPEIAFFGKNEAQLKVAGANYAAHKAFFAANARALAQGESEGLLKILSDKASGQILGAHIIGTFASELIFPLQAAQSARTPIQQLARTIPAHPSLSEIITAGL